MPRRECIISPSGVMINRSLLLTNIFDESLPACEDHDLWIRLSKIVPISLDPNKTVIKYGGHVDQLSSQFGLDQYRIKALKKELSNNYSLKIKTLINQKLKILKKGTVKRYQQTITGLVVQ